MLAWQTILRRRIHGETIPRTSRRSWLRIWVAGKSDDFRMAKLCRVSMHENTGEKSRCFSHHVRIATCYGGIQRRSGTPFSLTLSLYDARPGVAVRSKCRHGHDSSGRYRLLQLSDRLVQLDLVPCVRMPPCQRNEKPPNLTSYDLKGIPRLESLRPLIMKTASVARLWILRLLQKFMALALSFVRLLSHISMQLQPRRILDSWKIYF